MTHADDYGSLSKIITIILIIIILVIIRDELKLCLYKNDFKNTIRVKPFKELCITKENQRTVQVCDRTTMPHFKIVGYHFIHVCNRLSNW